MNVSPQATAHRGVRLLARHLESLDHPEAVPARERLEEEIGAELAHKLVFALAPRHGPEKRRRGRAA
jgi:hypothetical protein